MKVEAIESFRKYTLQPVIQVAMNYLIESDKIHDLYHFNLVSIL